MKIKKTNIFTLDDRNYKEKVIDEKSA